MDRNLLLVLATLPALFTYQAKSSDGLDTSVKWTVTSNTLEWPEVHLLFENNEQNDVEFLLYLQPALTCGNTESASSAYVPTDDHFWPESRNSVRGTIPAQGWNHRTFRLGSDADLRQHLPCTLEVEVGLYGESRNKNESLKIPLPNKVISREAEPPNFDSLVAGWLVEQVYGSDDLLIRIYLKNTREKGIMVGEASRNIACSSERDSLVHWNPSSLIRQGEGGPLYIASKSWGIFLAAVHVDDESVYGSCVAKIGLTGNGGEIRMVKIPLEPQGQLQQLFDHPVPPTGESRK